MSTAIVWAYISRGFVIGADGRRTDDATGLVVDDAVRKIFGVKIANMRLVYAWSGTTVLMNEGNTPALDFKQITDCILQSIDMSSVSAFSDFLRLFNNALYTILLSPVGMPLRLLAKPMKSEILFLGYFEGQPYTAEISIKYDGPTISKPEIKCPPVSNRLDVFAGSKRVCEEFYELPKLEPSSLDEAHALVQEYITHCIKYQDVDPECAKIGGRVHTGKLTPDGFSWICPPILD